MLLTQIRETIEKELPSDVQETISYGVPTFKLNGSYVIYFAGYKKHVSIYPIININSELGKKIEPYVTGKGTMQFPLDKPFPFDLLREFTRAKLQENLERTKKSK
jgi:uncharacterized protein YdhG (YjbR/CyaY superfamily)